MKRKIGLVVLAILALVALSACQQQAKIPGLEVAGMGQTIVKPSAPANTPPSNLQTPTTAPTPDWDLESNPGEEEGVGLDEMMGDAGNIATAWPFAGATPMPLDPIDMPTPTPRPKLAFSFQTYALSSLGITFDAPLGWVQDDTVDSTVILRQPENEIMDNYRAFVSIEVRSTGSTLSKSDMKSQLNGIFETLSGNYVSWTPKVASDRTLIGEAGMYNDYRGVMSDGTIVRGRVQVASVNKKTVTLHISCPAGFNEDYMGSVYTKIRATLKEI